MTLQVQPYHLQQQLLIMVEVLVEYQKINDLVRLREEAHFHANQYADQVEEVTKAQPR